ncbi:MAG: phenylalanine--tRNA ligase beta subunit-related protein [Roseburia intestinalis]
MDDSVLMICDGKKAIGIAGIMGGENSMITDNVKTMLFEAACFDGTNIRLSGKKVGTAYRCFQSKFEKGLDPNNAQCEAIEPCLPADRRTWCTVKLSAVWLMFTQNERGQNVFHFEPERINNLLGTDIAKRQCWIISKDRPRL